MQQETYIYATGNNMEIIRFQYNLRQKKIRHTTLLMEGNLKLLIFVCTGMRLKETERKPGIIMYRNVLYYPVMFKIRY